MVSTPLKFIRPISKTLPIDLDKFLTCFIKEYYGDKTVAKFKRSIEDVNKLRNQQLLSTSNSFDPNLKKISEYYLVLKSLEPIIAPEKNQVFIDNEWSHSQSESSFSYEKSYDSRFSFEMVNVLFALAMNIFKNLYNRKIQNNSDLEKFINSREKLVGCFAEIKKYSLNDGLILTSLLLSPSYIDIIINKFLIEIQLKIIINGPQDDLEKLKRMCAYTESCASETLESLLKQDKLFYDEELKKILESMIVISRSKMNMFQSLIEKRESRHGNSVAYARLAEEVASKFLKEAKGDYSHLIVLNKEPYRQIFEENERIFKSVIPKSVEYPRVEKLQIVQPAKLTYENLLDGNKCELAEEFNKMVPLVVRKATTTFLLRISQLSSEYSIRSLKNEYILNDALAKLNTPAYFEKFDENTLPFSITQKINFLTMTNGIESVEKNLELLSHLLKENEESLKKAFCCLKNEFVADLEYKTQILLRLRRQSSLKASQLFIDMLKNYSGSFEKLKTYKVSLGNYFFLIKPSLILLIDNKMELCRLNKEKNHQISQLKSEIQDKIYELYNKVNTDKQKELELFKIFEIDENEIEIIFSNNLKIKGFLGIDDEYQKLINDIKPTIIKIEKINENRASIANEFEEYSNNLKTIQGSQFRLDTVLSDYNCFVAIQKSINEAILFLGNFNNNLSSFQNKIDDFCLSRLFEANQIIKNNDLFKFVLTNSLVIDEHKYLYPKPPEKRFEAMDQRYFERYFPREGFKPN